MAKYMTNIINCYKFVCYNPHRTT